MPEQSPTADFILSLARQAGEVIARLRDQLQVDFKGGHELVTQADLAADQLIRDSIQASFPAHRILSEELAPDASSDAQHLWVIDPIDGTVNYAHQHPQVAISIAYFCDGQAQLAVVHNPFLNETFFAQRGQGARLNDQPVHCAETSDMQRAIIATGFPYQKPDLPQLMRRLTAVLQHCADVRRLGSAALDICWVACGRMDGYYETVKPWDSAAARLIASEAGAMCGHIHPLPEGENEELFSENILIAVPALFKPLQSLLQQADG
ncbi:inositol monophosphatase family protein [Thalassolituus marinus]|uniref:Inositol-1-monophosphatase n=1 Tax=Thalassolituus marinus TaxID=671053 RepID=A0ABS7ZMW7_9GAMM|nr:inositol monophosphatase family protein [Thalassolituus marinus]MCA6063056.1 inositol monophosphatase [Thalassolituus marinus]